MQKNPQLVIGSGGWDRRFLELAQHFATWSKDPSTKVGCVIVGPDHEIVSTGFNGFPRGIVDSDARLTNRSLKYPLVCHGEENAMLQAARVGVSLKGCIAYCTWPPCTGCARKFVQVGVIEVIYPADVEIPERWAEDFELSNQILEESGIIVRKVKIEEPTRFIDVSHCRTCEGVTFETTSDVCSCGSELDPQSKRLETNKSHPLDSLKT